MRFPTPRTARRLGVLVLAAAVLGACNDDGRSLAAAPEPVPTASTTPGIVPGSPDDGVVGFRLRSDELADGGLLTVDHSCDGLNVPPVLRVHDVPEGTVELALTMVDTDVDAVHWIVAGLAPVDQILDPASFGPEIVFGSSDGGTDGWDGPCPPIGDAPHPYQFAVYALPVPSGITEGARGITLVDRLRADAIDLAVLTGFYARAG